MICVWTRGERCGKKSTEQLQVERRKVAPREDASGQNAPGSKTGEESTEGCKEGGVTRSGHAYARQCNGPDEGKAGMQSSDGAQCWKRVQQSHAVVDTVRPGMVRSDGAGPRRREEERQPHREHYRVDALQRGEEDGNILRSGRTRERHDNVGDEMQRTGRGTPYTSSISARDLMAMSCVSSASRYSPGSSYAHARWSCLRGGAAPALAVAK